MVLHSQKRNSLVFIALAALALLLYYPILNNEFLSDDYDSLYRICIERQILFKEFLRPLIDISFYINYLISGLESWSYYVFNLCVHIVNAFLLYRLALSYPLFDGDRQKAFAFMSAFLFLVYPFHNEGIVWLTGRLSSIACLFALIALNVWLGSLKPKVKLFWCLFLYFAGLLAYESILFLPLVAVILSLKDRLNMRQAFRHLVWAAAIIGFSLLIRFLISGAVYGDYGERMVALDAKSYLFKMLKTFGRSVLPPSENSGFLEAGFGIVIIFLIWVHFKLIRKYRTGKLLPARYLKIVGCFLTAMIIPMLFGISTRTPEGDRLLYFPSLFLCMMLSFLVIAMIRRRAFQWLCFSMLLFYFIFFLILNNRQWEKASATAGRFLQTIAASEGKPVYLINIPDELEGSFVFRNGFDKALVLHQMDTSKVFVVGYLTRLEYLKIDGPIPIEKNGPDMKIRPSTQISDKGNGLLEITNPGRQHRFLFNKNTSLVYYWNKSELIRLF